MTKRTKVKRTKVKRTKVKRTKVKRTKEIAKEIEPEPLINQNIDFQEVHQDQIKALVINYLSGRFKSFSNASELIATSFMRENKVYSTREDVSPEIWIYRDGIFIPKGKTYLEEFTREKSEKEYSSKLLSLVVSKVRADTYIDPEKFFEITNFEEVPVLNGILHLEKRTLRPYSPDDIFFNKLPVAYDPQAKCPAIDKHLQDVLKNEGDAKVFYEIAGYCLEKTHNVEKAFILVGDGRNGKGKSLMLLKNLVGQENCASVPLASMKEESFNLHQLHRKMINLAGDLSQTSLKDTGVFKSLTGRDLVTAHRKFQGDIIFQSYAKNIFAANELPKVYDFSRGFWSRWVLLEFPYEFVPVEDYNKLNPEERGLKKIMDVDHISKISTPTELSGFLNSALDGLKRLRNQKDFSQTIGTSQIKDLWVRRSNSFIGFCFDALSEDLTEQIKKSDLRRVYNAYCKKFRVRAVSENEIKATLCEMFAAEDFQSHEGERFWRGIRYSEKAEFKFDEQQAQQGQHTLPPCKLNSDTPQPVHKEKPVAPVTLVENNQKDEDLEVI